MRPIPKKLKDQLANDPWMKKCVVCRSTPVTWNHAIIYSGRQLNTWYALVPLCANCHMGNSMKPKPDVQDYCEWLAILRGGKELDNDCPKWNWRQRKKYLDSKFLK